MKYRVDIDLYANGKWTLGSEADNYDTYEAAQYSVNWLMDFERKAAGDKYTERNIPFAVYRIQPVPGESKS